MPVPFLLDETFWAGSLKETNGFQEGTLVPPGGCYRCHCRTRYKWGRKKALKKLVI